MNYQSISEQIVERLKTTNSKNFMINGCNIILPKHSIKKILYYDENTLAEFFIDKGHIFTRTNITNISNYAYLEIIFNEGTVKIAKGNVFTN